jgi:dimethylamine monooxygenase subunit A
LTVEATLEGTWLRVERQALVALPRSGGVCFGIRVESHPLTVVKADAVACEGLRRALETMPSAMADYKGLSVSRARLIQLLGDGDLFT